MDSQEIDRICLQVYRARLDADCAGDSDRQVAKDKDNGAKQMNRARFCRPVVIETLIAVGLHDRPKRGRTEQEKTDDE